MTQIAVVGPWLSDNLSQPPSGVANYLHDLLTAGPLTANVTVVAQRGCKEGGPVPRLRVQATWAPNLLAAVRIIRTLVKERPSVLHLHHEFRLFGSIINTATVFLGVAFFRRRLRIIVTVHGVVSRREAVGSLLGQARRRTNRRLSCVAFAASYRYLAWLADDIIVLHDALREILTADYGVGSVTIPIGLSSKQAEPEERDASTALLFGFLTSYKCPELVLDLAEANVIPNAYFIISVALNPRDHSEAYKARYKDIERRARALGARGRWHPYLDDTTLSQLLRRATVVVMPYTSLVAATAIGAQAIGSGIAICYSSALEPIFGSGRGMFEMTLPSLKAALIEAFEEHYTTKCQLPSCIETLRLTELVWQTSL